MEGFPEEVFQSDVNTFPRGDPRMEEMAKAAKAKFDKEVALEQKRAKQDAAELEKAVKATRAKGTPVPTATAEKTKTAAAAKGKPGDEAKRYNLKLRKCKLYFTKLGDKIAVKEPKAYPKTEEGIDELLAEIESDLHSQGGIQQAGLWYVNSCVGLEQLSLVFNPLGWDLIGPATSLAATVAGNKKQWDDLVTEFAIANAEWFMMGPGKRLIATTVQMILAVDGANKAAIARGAAPVAANPELVQSASDL